MGKEKPRRLGRGVQDPLKDLPQFGDEQAYVVRLQATDIANHGKAIHGYTTPLSRK